VTRTRTLLDLAVTVDPAHDPARRAQLALLAGRLGYGEVWLPASAPPPVDEVAALAAAAAPARVGVALPSLALPGVETLATAVPDLLFAAPPGPSPVASGRVRQVGGRVAGVVTPATAGGPGEPAAAGIAGGPGEPHGAGIVLAAPDRAHLVRGVAAAVAERTRTGLTAAAYPVVADVPVAIGRTMREAEARAARDPRFAGERHPRHAGLFGTYEHGQGQVLELAAAGADGLLVTLADELDVADLLAQVRALVVGATPVLHARRG
jgi:hypothetical protein